MTHLILMVVLIQSSGAPPINTVLGDELVRMGKEDQRHRTETTIPWREQNAIDERNMKRLEEIIAQYGWPGRSLVGNEAALAAFLILQHTDLSRQKKYFGFVKNAALKGEVPRSAAAMLEDRILMGEGKKQIYGTQLRSGPDTGGKLVLHLIDDEANVDVRRAAVGLKPLAEYLKEFGLTYAPPARK
jgi:hypothetical protein